MQYLGKDKKRSVNKLTFGRDVSNCLKFCHFANVLFSFNTLKVKIIISIYVHKNVGTGKKVLEILRFRLFKMRGEKIIGSLSTQRF